MSLFIRFRFHRLCLIFTLLFATVGCDQITKAVARNAISAAGSLHYFNNTLVLTHAENPGAFLSLGADMHNDFRFVIFTLISGLMVLGAMVYLFRQQKLSKWQTIALSLFVAGGFGNLIDRIDRGSVTDFINLGIGSLRTGIFNIADVAIVAGLLLYVLASSKKNSPASLT
jgi:signal peptidase II